MQKNPTEKEPKDQKLNVEIIIQKITPSSEFIENIEIEKWDYGFKFLTVHDNFLKSGIPFWPMT